MIGSYSIQLVDKPVFHGTLSNAISTYTSFHSFIPFLACIPLKEVFLLKEYFACLYLGVEVILYSGCYAYTWLFVALNFALLALYLSLLHCIPKHYLGSYIYL